MNRALERNRNIIDFALSSLIRRKGKNLSLLAVYTLIVFMIASTVFFIQALKREAALILKDAPDMVVQRMIAGRNDPIPISYGEKIAAIRGVDEVQPRLWGYYFDAVVGANYTLMAGEEKSPAANNVIIGTGVARYPPSGRGGRHGVSFLSRSPGAAYTWRRFSPINPNWWRLT